MIDAIFSPPGDRRCDGHSAESRGRWWALRTRSRHERILAAELTRAGIAAWSPTVRRAEQFGACRVSVERPLFPGEVFLHGVPDDVDRARATGRVLEVIEFADQVRVGEELVELWHATTRGETPERWDVAGRTAQDPFDRWRPAKCCTSPGSVLQQV